jgi:hypothetical protein
MSKTSRATTYVFTADPMSASDMQQIAIVKRTVKSMNDQAKQSHAWAVKRAEYYGEVAPKAPARYRVRLMGRGPRRVHANTNYGGRYNSAYDSYLPQRYATHFDVYIHEVR